NITELVNLLEISCGPNWAAPATLYFNKPTDVTIPNRRFGMDPNPGTSPYNPPIGIGQRFPTLAPQDPGMANADLLLTEVLSFRVEVLSPQVDPSNFAPLPVTPTSFLFDSWSKVQDNVYNMGAVAAPSQITIRALKVTV